MCVCEWERERSLKLYANSFMAIKLEFEFCDPLSPFTTSSKKIINFFYFMNIKAFVQTNSLLSLFFLSCSYPSHIYVLRTHRLLRNYDRIGKEEENCFIDENFLIVMIFWLFTQKEKFAQWDDEIKIFLFWPFKVKNVFFYLLYI